MILHLLTDEKFADYAIHQFSVYGTASRFVLVVEENEIKMVSEKVHTWVVRIGSSAFTELMEQLGDYKAIVFHGMFSPWQEQIISMLPTYTKVAWMFWGGEIYGRKDVLNSFLAPCSKVLYFCHTIKNSLFGRSFMQPYYIPKSIFRRVDYCLTDMKQECEYAMHYLQHEMQMLWYNYYSIEETIGESLLKKTCKGTGIFVGNSASIENNHIDLFLKLSRLPIQKRTIVAPISYGTPWYRNVVQYVGNRLFRSQFTPLLEYMDRMQYNGIILSCNTMIMPHYRAQAQGNIITGLWLGMRVYLYARSFAYQYFNGLGMKIYSIDRDLDKNNPNLFAPMDEEDIKNNRAILLHTYGDEAMMTAVNNVFQELNEG